MNVTGLNRPYSIVSLTQGTKEWLEWRHQGIGASEAPTIMGENPWKWPDQLRIEKKRAVREGTQNEAMATGTALEPVARAHYCSTVGMVVEPACLQSLEHDWLRASVDGITADGQRVVEIKCGQSVYRKTAGSRRAPDYYYGQLQHILAITGLPVIDFLCFFPPNPPLLIEVRRNDAYIQKLLAAEKAFWQRLKD